MKKIILITLIILTIVFSGILGSCSNNSNLNDNNLETGNPNNEDASNSDEGMEIKMVNVYCGNNVLEIELSNNASAKAFVEKLKEGDVIVRMDDYGNFEKVGPLGFSIVQSNSSITTKPGDVILYLGSNITIYYDTNSWNFTLLGRIKDMTREKMLDFFGGKGKVTVRFSLK